MSYKIIPFNVDEIDSDEIYLKRIPQLGFLKIQQIKHIESLDKYLVVFYDGSITIETLQELEKDYVVKKEMKSYYINIYWTESITPQVKCGQKFYETFELAESEGKESNSYIKTVKIQK